MSDATGKTLSKQLEFDFRDEAGAIWRPIHYLGSKLRLVGEIQAALNGLGDPLSPVCDLFAGSGTVAFALSRNRPVIASDIQEYSRVLCSALLNPKQRFDNDGFLARVDQHFSKLSLDVSPLLEFESRAFASASALPEDLCDIVEYGANIGSIRKFRGYTKVEAAIERRLLATKYFGGIYFAMRQTIFLDSVLMAIARLPEEIQDVPMAALLSTASALVNTIGKQFAQPLRPRDSDGNFKQHLLAKLLGDRTKDGRNELAGWLNRYTAIRSKYSHQVIRCDYRDALKAIPSGTIVYADPPYTRDHYSRFYHVLETLSLKDFPKVSRSCLGGGGLQSRGNYRVDRHQSPFCIKSQAEAAFVELFELCSRKKSPLLLSYSPTLQHGHPRVVAVETIVEAAKPYFKKISITPVSHISHSKLNKTELNNRRADESEVLIACALH